MAKEKKNKTVENTENKSTVTRKTRPKAFFLTWILCFLVWAAIIVAGTVGVFALKTASSMLEGIPELSLEALDSEESSVIYDNEGNKIIELGEYLRENVEYDQLPNDLIDAFLAIEDSRYFTHFGFDIPRFTAAALVNLRSGSFDQGGSTITMQLIKNSYFQIDAGSDSTMAEREGLSGVTRKAQEIVLAIQADHTYSKEELLALFLNKVNFGNNIRGVEKASQYYFGKSVSELSLPESAFLAGIINSPNLYNPYNDIEKYSGNIYLNEEWEYLESAMERRDEVLDLMLQHGYITEDECALAKTVKLEDLLAGQSEKFDETSEYYQAYVDAVIDEVFEKTGKDPYYTHMEIYSNMDAHMQKYVYDLQNENVDAYHVYYTNDKMQSALVVLDNQTGALIALGGGRNTDESQSNQSRLFNRAVDSRIQPGSTIKPIFEYALAFEYLGWATSHTICDQPVYLYNGHNLISNAGNQGYTGDMLITEAVARSLNTPAVQTLMALVDEVGTEVLCDYLTAIGFEVTPDEFDLQFAIGGNTMRFSPADLAAAHGMLMNKGYYIEPHTIKYIEFNDGTTYVSDTEGTQLLSEGAAYLTAYLERYNVASSSWINLMEVFRQCSYPVYAKTGTTDWGDSGLSYGVPKGSPRDLWQVAQTSNYTVSVWLGFDKLDTGTYFQNWENNYNQKGYMAKAMLDELMNYYQYEATEIEQPEDVVSITHIKGVYPYCYPTSGTSVTGLIKSEYATLVDISTVPRTTKVGTLTGVGVSWNEDGSATLTWYGFSGGGSSGTKDISATNAFGETTRATGRSYYNLYNYINPSYFYADIYRNGEHIGSVESTYPSTQIWVEGSEGDTYQACGWTSSDYSQQCTGF